MKPTLSRLSLLLGLSLVACGDNENQNPPDAPPPAPDAPAPDAPPPPDAPPTGFETPMAVPVDISSGGADQLQSIAAGPDNTFVAAGFFQDSIADARSLIVLKITNRGVPVAGFGDADGVVDGFAEIRGVSFVGGNDEIDVAVQADGKIVVSATIDDLDSANVADRDVAVVRLTANGALDTTFSGDGIATISLADVGEDSARGLAVSADGVFVHGAARAAVGTNVDFTVAKLTLAGELDATFAGDGIFQVGLGNTLGGAQPRGIHVLADGKILAVGYVRLPTVADPAVTSNQPVLYKLTAAGALDATFSGDGIFNEIVLIGQTEVYNVAIHGDSIVTAGYGRPAVAPPENSYVSLRFNLQTGVRDLGWGGAVNGAVTFDPSGTGLTSNCRNAVALPGGKTLLVGSTGPANMPAQDAVFAVLDANGRLDTAYGTGIHKYALRANGADQFWGAAVSGGVAAAIGYSGVMTQAAASNDDSYGTLFALQP